jgi:surfactin synthase thioesterase subunit
MCLIVSGNPGPGICRGEEKIRYLRNKVDLKEELKSMGGVSQEFITNDELFDFFEPILRADFEIVERNALMNEPVVCAPIIALMGREEKNYEKIANWGKFTKSKFNCKILPGGHFFMFDDPSELVSSIKTACNISSIL